MSVRRSNGWGDLIVALGLGAGIGGVVLCLFPSVRIIGIPLLLAGAVSFMVSMARYVAPTSVIAPVALGLGTLCVLLGVISFAISKTPEYTWHHGTDVVVTVPDTYEYSYKRGSQSDPRYNGARWTIDGRTVVGVLHLTWGERPSVETRRVGEPAPRSTVSARALGDRAFTKGKVNPAFGPPVINLGSLPGIPMVFVGIVLAAVSAAIMRAKP